MVDKNAIKKMKILTVDDDPSSLKLVKTILLKDGFQHIQTASSGIESIEMMKNDPPDLILLDIIMPGMYGDVVCQKIKSQDQFKTTPILMVTSAKNNGNSMLEKCFAAGATDFINKPISPIEFLARVKSALTMKQTYNQMETELTMRIKAERERQASESQARLIIEKNADGIVIIDERGIIIFANPSTENIFDRDTKEIVGNDFGFPFVERGTAEMNIIKPNGKIASVEMRVEPIKWEGASSYLASLRDVSDRKEAEEKLKDTLAGLRKTLGATVEAMAMTIEKRDPYTAGHQRRVATIAWQIAQEMGLSDHKIEGLRMAAVIHDLGKISIPAEILSKPGRLNCTEFDLIKYHSQVGYDILKNIEFPWPIADIVLQHHEKMDGSGYPQSLKGDQIRIEARILTVSDVLEAMASHRPYRPALGIDIALEEITNNKGKLFDPQAVDACLRAYKKGMLDLN